MRVYVIRHGESETNLSKQFTGWQDVHLTEKGKEQAKRAGLRLQHIPFDKIYSSDLQRARETAEAALPGCTYEITALAREINVGNLMTQPFAVLTPEQREETVTDGYAAYGGESKEDLYGRIRALLKELEGQNCETVAVFCHGGWLRAMLEIVLGTYLPRKSVCCDNCAVGIFEFTDNTWILHSWINQE